MLYTSQILMQATLSGVKHGQRVRVGTRVTAMKLVSRRYGVDGLQRNKPLKVTPISIWKSGEIVYWISIIVNIAYDGFYK